MFALVMWKKLSLIMMPMKPFAIIEKKKTVMDTDCRVDSVPGGMIFA